MVYRPSTSGYHAETTVPSAARTTSDSATSSVGPTQTIRAQLDVTAASGTSPTLDVMVEDSLDGTNWNMVGTFAQLTATGREVIDIATPCAENIRVSWTVGGTTPSFTFSVRLAAFG